jgi:hypothetical protein
VKDAIDAKVCRTCVEHVVPASKGQINSGESRLGDRDHVVDLGLDFFILPKLAIREYILH